MRLRDWTLVPPVDHSSWGGNVWESEDQWKQSEATRRRLHEVCKLVESVAYSRRTRLLTCGMPGAVDAIELLVVAAKQDLHDAEAKR